MIIVIKCRLLTSLPHHFNTTFAENFPGYDYAIGQNIGRSVPQTVMKFLTKGAQPPELLTRLLARRASRRPGTPLEQKMDAFGRPNFGGKGKLFSIISLSILIYLKRNSFNSHYYYTFDILINLMIAAQTHKAKCI